jgi:hypothetical protein
MLSEEYSKNTMFVITKPRQGLAYLVGEIMRPICVFARGGFIIILIPNTVFTLRSPAETANRELQYWNCCYASTNFDHYLIASVLYAPRKAFKHASSPQTRANDSLPREVFRFFQGLMPVIQSRTGLPKKRRFSRA